MKYLQFLLFGITLSVLTISQAAAQKTITFPSQDSLMITADTYIAHADKKTPLIVLFHQAGWSRGEYREIAPKLNALGFNCIAVDQRSGGVVNGVPNETVRRAETAGKNTAYPDARQDMIAALKYARQHFADGKLIAWGSSYSAALVLQIVGSQPELADGALSFSPGEYFSRFGKSNTWVRDAAKHLKIPVFFTSAQKEQNSWSAIFAAIPSKSKTSFIPPTPGNHGSRALWEKFDDNDGYWKAVKAFLKTNFLN